jgi:hypothetical protein
MRGISSRYCISRAICAAVWCTKMIQFCIKKNDTRASLCKQIPGRRDHRSDISLPLTCVWTLSHCFLSRQESFEKHLTSSEPLCWQDDHLMKPHETRQVLTKKLLYFQVTAFILSFLVFMSKTFCFMKQILSWEANISHETAICNNSLIHRRQKKHDRSLLGLYVSISPFLRKNKGKQLYWAQRCHRRYDCNPTVQWCGNLSVTNGVGYDKLLFHERCISWASGEIS